MQSPPQSSSGDAQREPTQPLERPAIPADRSTPGQTQPPGQPTSPSAWGTAIQPGQSAYPGSTPDRINWITFSQLRGHPLVDITEGKNIGSVENILLDQQRQMIQAFATRGGILRKPTLVPALKAKIGLDAVTFQPGALAGQDTSWLDRLPKATDLIGMRILSDKGQFVGTVEDLRIDANNGMLVALELTPSQAGIPHRLGSSRQLLPTTGVISYGPDAIIAREGTISEL